MTINRTYHQKLRRLLLASFTLLIATATSVNAVVVDSKSQKIRVQKLDGITTDRIIVKYKKNAKQNQMSKMSTSSMQSISQKAGIQMQHLRQMSTGAQIMKLGEKTTKTQMDKIIDNLMQDPNIEYAEPDRLLKPQFIPNDPSFNEQWHYFEAAGGLNLPTAWDSSTGEGVVVAVIDTGFRPHADLDGNLLPGFDMISSTAVSQDGDGRDPDATDPGDFANAGDCGPGEPRTNSSWHGTHVAGTIAAETNNGNDVAGVAFNAKVVPVRALGRCGGFTSDIADGMIWAAGGRINGLPINQNPAQVLNLSLGGGGRCSRTSQNAVNTARSLGATVVVAAGNESANAINSNPANCNGVIAVAAVGRNGGRASYSNFGSVVDLAAPGGDQRFGRADGVLSTLNSGTRGPGRDALAFFQGTSMATPHVAGAAALLYSLNRNITPDEVETILKNTARTFPASCNQCGAGIVDATAAVAVLDNSNPAPEDPEPTPECVPNAVNLGNTIDFSNNAPGSASVSNNGCSITLSGNEWRITDFDFTIDASTELSFDFSATGTAEIQGVGFDQDLGPNSDRIFRLAGTQNFGFNNFSYTGNGATQKFTIPVGEFFTGTNFGFVITNDKDSGVQNHTVTVSNVVVSSASSECDVQEGFESNAGGWTNDSGSSCSTGSFVRGTPNEVVSGGVITQLAGANSGVNAIFTAANRSAGADDVDGGNCIASSPIYPVSQASTLSVSFFHGQRDTGDDAGDFFQLALSTDGGNTFSPLATNGDNRLDANWNRATASIPGNSNVVLRLQCSDGPAAGDLIECGIDDISICPQ